MAQQTRLTNGLNVVSFNQPAQEYGAVFVVPTPTLDSSGVAHLIEHLVFRYSERYPHRHTFFAANSLLPIKIDASSHQGFSYFYAVSSSKSVLLKVVGYLFAGITQHSYHDDDIKRERDGVLARELAMYQATAEYQLKMSIWRGDRTPDCYHHWAGYGDTLAQITGSDVTQYKTQYYQPDNITLLLGGVAADELPLLCTSPVDSAAPDYQPKQHKFVSTTLKDDYIFSWWLPECYIDGLLSSQERLSQAMQKHDMKVYIESSANHQRKFAMRLIGRPGKLMEAQQTLIDEVRRLHIVPKQHIFLESSYPDTINALLAWYHGQQPLNRKVVALSQALASTPAITGKRPLLKPVVRLPGNKADFTTTCPLVNDVLLPQAPALPGDLPARLDTLAQSLSNAKHFVFNQQDWIMHVPLSDQTGAQQAELLIGVLCDERLWLPRTSGQCYAMGVQGTADGIRIYGVMDDEPQQRNKLIEQLFTLYREQTKNTAHNNSTD
ncbi:insulinase family protein [Alteromonas gilva]|uniref:Insulinase family protein n=1 Tax=Alteromonas gilva TaxID=2987522 RepID=A0ABT5L568_9ALTE|nr:insulinase family protein [Alteromonas gilva]MDC8832007.1 insulinase family protein [Alteromonas gilva]